MTVEIWNLNASMKVKAKGFELKIYNSAGDTYLGDLAVTKAGLIWCKGKTTRKKGKKISWSEFMTEMDARP